MSEEVKEISNKEKVKTENGSNQTKGCDSKNCSKTDCKSCAKKKKNLKLPPNEKNKIKKIVAVVSGKGGVGKSSVTAMIAVALRKQGYKVGVLDADITGPSIPQVFGVHAMAEASKKNGIIPLETSTGIKLMSINLLLEAEDAPVVWRGPVIAGVVKQFWTDVIWGELDYLLIDMPPGTGDVPLTVFQSFPVNGILMITTPQSLVSMIVKKACKMADRMQIPVLGVIENYSYIRCATCGDKMPLFGKSKLEEFAKENNLEILGQLPMDSKFTELEDEGRVEEYEMEELQKAVDAVKALMN
ncbi:nucleotide-binding protein [Lachnospiraceae bacterium TWA4]|nr:nucleotide-binding protein [Lachnospiraceae bacterium TWA4]